MADSSARHSSARCPARALISDARLILGGDTWTTCLATGGAVVGNEKTLPSWWTTLPGVITAIAGLLTALGGFIAVLHTAGVFEWPKVSENAKLTEPRQIPEGKGTERATPSTQAESETHATKAVDARSERGLASYDVPGRNGGTFVEKDGSLVSRDNGGPLCPTPPGWRIGCNSLDPQFRQNWRNTPDGYVANGRKVKTFTNRSERVFEIIGTKHAFYVDDGHLYDYPTATILCPWPKAGAAQCRAIEAQYQDRWRNTPDGFIADGRAFNRDEVMRQVREGLL